MSTSNDPARQNPPNQKGLPARFWQFRQRDQIGTAVLAVLGVVALGGRWAYLRFLGERLVPWKTAPEDKAALLIDINKADWPELALLPDLGETMAKRIIADRDARGRFSSPQDLLRVKGIGPKTLDNLLPHLAPIADEGAPAAGL